MSITKIDVNAPYDIESKRLFFSIEIKMQVIFSKIELGNYRLTKPQGFAILGLLTLPVIFPETVLLIGFGTVLFAILGLLLAKTFFQANLNTITFRYLNKFDQYQRIASLSSSMIVNALCIGGTTLALLNPVTTLVLIARILATVAIYINVKRLLVRSHFSENKIYPNIPFTAFQCVDSKNSIFMSLVMIVIGVSLLVFNPIVVLASIVQTIGIIAFIKAFSFVK